MNDLTHKVDDLCSDVKQLNGEVRKLSEIIERLIRVEEKNATMQKDLNGYGMRLAKYEEDLQKLSIKTALNSSKGDIIGRWVERLIWFIVIAALGVFDIFKTKGHL